jgi:D-alanyl-lipoteichoic acid acyltransferase DltB (MBOAT superfamily)
MSIPDRLALLPLIAIVVLFPIAIFGVFATISPRARIPAFAVVNMMGAAFLCVATTAQNVTPQIDAVVAYVQAGALLIVIYFAFILSNYYLLRRISVANGGNGTVAFAAPIVFLVCVKYYPDSWNFLGGVLSRSGSVRGGEFFVGVSYMAFRLSHLARDIQNDVVKMPTFSEYVSFAFFVPVLWVGPISSYSTFQQSLSNPTRSSTTQAESLLRVVVGLTKYLFLATLANQFTYRGLLLDGHPHHVVDLVIAIFAYTAYLYCNFSGFCDIAIGISGLFGIAVQENFAHPFGSRNLQEFWTRWHMTLSSWFRDMMFTPLLKLLVRRFGPGSMDHMVAVCILTVFLAVGIWHGIGVNFALFGLAQALGLILVHYYNLRLKRRLGKVKYAAYQKNRAIRLIATAITITYFSASLFLFANSWSDMQRIFGTIV